MYPQQPPMPPPRPKRTSWLLWGCLGCGGLLVLALLFGGVGAALLLGGDDAPSSPEPIELPTEMPAQTPPEMPTGPPAEEPAAAGSIELTAEAVDFTPSALYSEGDYTSVLVTVVNNGEDGIQVTPFGFTVTDAQGATHGGGEGMVVDATGIDTVTLAPGQSVTGTVTASGAFEAVSVEFSELLGESASADVA